MLYVNAKFSPALGHEIDDPVDCLQISLRGIRDQPLDDNVALAELDGFAVVAAADQRFVEFLVDQPGKVALDLRPSAGITGLSGLEAAAARRIARPDLVPIRGVALAHHAASFVSEQSEASEPWLRRPSSFLNVSPVRASTASLSVSFSQRRTATSQ